MVYYRWSAKNKHICNFLRCVTPILFEISDDYNIEEANDDASDITTSLIGRFTEKTSSKISTR